MRAAAANVDWTFETARVRGRLVGEGDRELYRALYTDPAVMAHIGPVMDDVGADALLQKIFRCNAGSSIRSRYWRLSLSSSGHAIGQLSAIFAADDSAVVELGLMLLPANQGQGIGNEVSKRILDLLMGDYWGLSVSTVIAKHAGSNLRVGRLGMMLGFEHRGRREDALEAWCLTKSDWLASRSHFDQQVPSNIHPIGESRR